MDPSELAERLARGERGLTELVGIGPSSAGVAVEAAAGKIPGYLARLEHERSERLAGRAGFPGSTLLALLKGDCHSHSDWSDGGSPIAVMARTAKDIGHEYLVITDHSPRLKVANGLSAERLRAQQDEIKRLNEELAPFRLLSGIEVDICDDGALDQEPGLLDEMDVVVASVHSKLAMDRDAMTRRMCMALANPRMDILGHCTNRMVTGKGRPESEFDSELVIEAARSFDKAIEINCRPERSDPPMRILADVEAAGVKVSIDTDAHAPGQLHWQSYGCERAERANLDPARVVNTWSVAGLLAWTGSHQE